MYMHCQCMYHSLFNLMAISQSLEKLNNLTTKDYLHRTTIGTEALHQLIQKMEQT